MQTHTHTLVYIDTSDILVERPAVSFSQIPKCQWQCNEIECVNQFNNQQSGEVAPFVSTQLLYSIRNTRTSTRIHKQTTILYVMPMPLSYRQTSESNELSDSFTPFAFPL